MSATYLSCLSTCAQAAIFSDRSPTTWASTWRLTFNVTAALTTPLSLDGGGIRLAIVGLALRIVGGVLGRRGVRCSVHRAEILCPL